MIDKDFLERLEVAGYFVLPVNKAKEPIIKWRTGKPDKIPWHRAYGIAIVCGPESEGVEVIDIEGKIDKDLARNIYNEIVGDSIVSELISFGNLYAQKTMHNGYHIIYRYEAQKYKGSTVLARDSNGKVLVETRANGGLALVHPSPGYDVLFGRLEDLKPIPEDERDYLIDLTTKIAAKFVPQEPKKKKSIQGTNPTDTESALINEFKPFYGDMAVDYLNTKPEVALDALLKTGWTIHRETEGKFELCRPGRKNDTHATLNYDGSGKLYIFSTEAQPFEANQFYSVYDVVRLALCGGSYHKAYDIACHYYLEQDDVPVRIGSKYFKTHWQTDRFGNPEQLLNVYTADVLKIDVKRIGKKIEHIPVLRGYTMQPDYFNGYRRVINRDYNYFASPPHKPVPGDITWTMRLLEHVFGDQLQQGLKYLWFLFCRPWQQLPILALVSRERATGKTTFINWLATLAGNNLVYANPESLTKNFNFGYARAHIIVFEETIISEKQSAIEKLKALSTAKRITIERKFVDEYQVDFCGHIILASNYPDMFIRIDQEEVRFFVRKLTFPKFKNLKIEEDLKREAPAFLYYLQSLPPYEILSRDGFTPEELQNEYLDDLKAASRSNAANDIIMGLHEWFANHPEKKEIYATAGEINEVFCTRERYSNAYIGRVLRDEVRLGHPFQKRYTPEIGNKVSSWNGLVYHIRREHIQEMARVSTDAPPPQERQLDDTLPF